jgi:hypothetical protein
LAEDRYPSVGTDEEAGPKGNHDKGEEDAAIGGASATDGIGGRVSHENADGGSEQGVENGIPKNRKPSGIETAAIVIPVKGVDDPTEFIATTETGDDEEDCGQQDEEC